MLRTELENGSVVETERAETGRARRFALLSLGLWLSVSLLAAGVAAPAHASDPFEFDLLEMPRFQYNGSESKPPSVSFRRNEIRAVEAPTRYRTTSILQYTRALGDTGMLLRVKAPLNPRKIVKVEIRF